MNQSNEIGATEYFYNRIGSYLVLDYLFIILIGPLGVIGFFLNLSIFFAFLKINFIKKPILKNYFIIYTLTSYLVSAISVCYSFTRVPRFLPDVAFSYSIAFVRCKFIAVGITLNFFSNILDCFILCERLSIINDKFKKILSLNSYYVCLIVFILTNLINMPQYFVNSPRNEAEFYEAMNNTQLISSFTYCKKELFFYGRTGNIILYLVTFIRDILTLIIEIIMIIYSIRIFKLYLNQSINTQIEIVIDHVDPSINSNVSKSKPTASPTNQQFNLQVPQLQNIANQQSNVSTCQVSNNQNHQKIIIVENFSNKLTKLSILISSMSILSHLGLTAVYVSYSSDTNNNSEWSHYATFLTCLFILLKYISNFFLFYFYNRNFRIYIYKIFITLIMCFPVFKF